MTLTYSDLRAYVMSGQKFPQNDSTFESLMPTKAFAEITTFDKDVYSVSLPWQVSIFCTCDHDELTGFARTPREQWLESVPAATSTTTTS